MGQKITHFMDEADIGSGEKTAAEQEDMESTKHLKEQQEQAKLRNHPLDGSQLQQVVEEQQYISQQENHVPQNPASAAENSSEKQPNQQDGSAQESKLPVKNNVRSQPQPRR